MTDPIIETPGLVTLLGGGPADPDSLTASLAVAPVLVAADGGADTALAAGLMPDAVIGDMDSLSHRARGQIPTARQHRIAEQDSTDFDKCLTRIRARAILAHGFTGGQLDHGLAACTSLVRHAAQTCILVGTQDICFVAPASVSLDLPAGTRLSLFPMGPVRGTSTGLAYPIDGIDMAPGIRVGTSNAVTGPVRLTFEARVMLVIVPPEALPAALRGLGIADLPAM